MCNGSCYRECPAFDAPAAEEEAAEEEVALREENEEGTRDELAPAEMTLDLTEEPLEKK